MDDDIFEYLRDDLKPPEYDRGEIMIEAGEVYKELADPCLYGAESKPV